MQYMKNLIFMLLLVIGGTDSILGQTATYSSGRKCYGFTNANGEWVIQPQYNSARSFSEGLAAVRIEKSYDNKLWGFINNRNELFIAAKYDDALDFENGLAPVKIGWKWGLINKQGQIVLPFVVECDLKMDKITKTGYTIIHGHYWGCKEYAVVKGQQIIIPLHRYTNISVFDENESLFYVENIDQYGVVDGTGREVIPCKYKKIEKWNALGLAKVKNDNGYGLINKQGKEIIPCQYYNIGDFDAKGRTKVEIRLPSIVRDNGTKEYHGKDGYEKSTFGIIDISGKEIIPCKYNYIDSNINKFPVKVGMYDGNKEILYGLINAKNEEVLSCKYHEIGNFDNNRRAWVRGEDGGGYIDKSYKFITPPRYTKVDIDSIEENGWIRVYKNDGGYGNNRLIGYINAEGIEVVPCKYTFIDKFDSSEFIKVGIGRKEGLINKQGKEIVECGYYASIKPFNSFGIAIVLKEYRYDEYFCGGINKEGKEIIPCKYISISNFDSLGFAVVSINPDREKFYGVINFKGETVIPCKYSNIYTTNIGGWWKVQKDEGAGWMKIVNNGYCNMEGKEVIPCIYSSISDFNDKSIALVAKSVREYASDIVVSYGYINKSGEEIVACKYSSPEKARSRLPKKLRE